MNRDKDTLLDRPSESILDSKFDFIDDPKYYQGVSTPATPQENPQVDQEKGWVGATGSAVARGAIGIAEMGLGAMAGADRLFDRYVMAEPENDPDNFDLKKTFHGWRKDIEEGKNKMFKPVVGGAKGTWAQGVESFVTSAGIKIPAFVVGTMTGGVGNVAGGILGMVATSPAFGLSQYDEAVEKYTSEFVSHGHSPEKARKMAEIPSLLEGSFEVLSESISDLISGRLMGPGLSIGKKKIAEHTLGEILKVGLNKETVKHVGKIAFSETAGEFLNSIAQGSVEEVYGKGKDLSDVIQDPKFWDKMQDQLGPIVVSSILFGVVGTGTHAYRNKQISDALGNPLDENQLAKIGEDINNPLAPLDDRISAVNVVAEDLARESETLSKAWLESAMYAVRHNESIGMDETLGQFEPELTEEEIIGTKARDNVNTGSEPEEDQGDDTNDDEPLETAPEDLPVGSPDRPDASYIGDIGAEGNASPKDAMPQNTTQLEEHPALTNIYDALKNNATPDDLLDEADSIEDPDIRKTAVRLLAKAEGHPLIERIQEAISTGKDWTKVQEETESEENPDIKAIATRLLQDSEHPALTQLKEAVKQNADPADLMDQAAEIDDVDIRKEALRFLADPKLDKNPLSDDITPENSTNNASDEGQDVIKPLLDNETDENGKRRAGRRAINKRVAELVEAKDEAGHISNLSNVQRLQDRLNKENTDITDEERKQVEGIIEAEKKKAKDAGYEIGGPQVGDTFNESLNVRHKFVPSDVIEDNLKISNIISPAIMKDGKQIKPAEIEVISSLEKGSPEAIKRDIEEAERDIKSYRKSLDETTDPGFKKIYEKKIAKAEKSLAELITQQENANVQETTEENTEKGSQTENGKEGEKNDVTVTDATKADVVVEEAANVADFTPEGLKAQKKSLLENIDDAIKHHNLKQIGEEPTLPENITTDDDGKTYTIDVPGDGTFKVLGSHLKNFRNKVSSKWPTGKSSKHSPAKKPAKMTKRVTDKDVGYTMPYTPGGKSKLPTIKQNEELVTTPDGFSGNGHYMTTSEVKTSKKHSFKRTTSKPLLDGISKPDTDLTPTSITSEHGDNSVGVILEDSNGNKTTVNADYFDPLMKQFPEAKLMSGKDGVIHFVEDGKTVAALMPLSQDEVATDTKPEAEPEPEQAPTDKEPVTFDIHLQKSLGRYKDKYDADPELMADKRNTELENWRRNVEKSAQGKRLPDNVLDDYAKEFGDKAFNSVFRGTREQKDYFTPAVRDRLENERIADEKKAKKRQAETDKAAAEGKANAVATGTIFTKSGKPFKSRGGANLAIKNRGLNETHKVVDTGDGFVIVPVEEANVPITEKADVSATNTPTVQKNHYVKYKSSGAKGGKTSWELVTSSNDKGFTTDRVKSLIPHSEVTDIRTDSPELGRGEVLMRDGEVIENPVEKPTVNNKIEDFGEVLQGARKHYADQLKDAEKLDTSAEPLSKTWPEPKYQQLIDKGFDPKVVALVRSLRESVPSRGRLSWKVRRYTKVVELLRSDAGRLLSGEISIEQFFSTGGALEDISSAADLYEAVGHEQSLKGISVRVGKYRLYAGEKFDPPKMIWTVQKKAKATAFGNWPSTLATGATREEAIANFKKKVDANPGAAISKAKAVPFIIYTKSDDNKVYIGKKFSARRYADLESFDTLKEARNYLENNQQKLEEKLEAYKKFPKERKETNAPRVGEDHLDGQDVTPERFAGSFGFKGVQFGNFVEQGKRQSDLNEAYDALMDLAGVLGVPAKALSLNGKLGLAFGARGRGGKDAPKAHYEPGTMVINLTKRAGAGSLAHEFFHALDNYFGKMRKESGSFVTDNPTGSNGDMRQEMLDAFKRVMDAIGGTGLKSRSQVNDRTKSKAYWATNTEMAARAFENYIIEKLHDNNGSNDYLANIVDQKAWDAAAAMGLEQENSYPYLTEAEMPAVKEAFQHFFDIVETRETDTGVALFTKTGEGIKNVVATLTGEELDGSFEAAREYYQDNLQKKTLHREEIGDIRITGKGWRKTKQGLKTDPLKIKLLPAIPDIIEKGSYHGRDSVEGRRDDIVAFHYFDGYVTVAGEDVRVGVTVGEDSRGNLYYNINHDADKLWIAKRSAMNSGKARGGEPSTGDNSSSPKYTITEGFEPVNVAILGRENSANIFTRASGETKAPKSMVALQVEKVINRLKLDNAPPVVVVQSEADLPAHLTDHIATQNAQGQVPALYDPKTGKVYIVADLTRNADDVQAHILHEVTGHFGLRGLLGDNLNPILDQVFDHYGEEAFDKIARDYELDLSKESDRRIAAEEMLAFMQKEPNRSFAKKVYANIRKLLRKLGFIQKVNDADIEQLLSEAYEFAQKGKPEGTPTWQKAVSNEAAFSFDEDAVFKIAKPSLARKLDSEPTIKVYRAMQLIDGKLYPPMSARVNGKLRKHTEIGVWEQAEERPDLVKGGKFKLDKANKSTIKARYNPYFHTSRSPLNDQFSSAYKRPNLVTVEVEVPVSELTSGYKADGAKDSVGEVSWNKGPVSSKLPKNKERKVILSRYAKVVRIIPDSEVASIISELLDGENIRIPEKIVTPSLRKELETAGVGIEANVRFSRRAENAATSYGASAVLTKLDQAKAVLSPAFDKFMYWAVDKNRPIQQVQRRLKNMSESMDVFLRETQRPKVTADLVRRVHDEHVKPLLESIAKSGFEMSDVEEYAHAKHAQEANIGLRHANSKRYLDSLANLLEGDQKSQLKADMADIKSSDINHPEQYYELLEDVLPELVAIDGVAELKDQWDTFSEKPSGMTDQTAKDILNSYKDKSGLEKIRLQLAAINDLKLDILHNAGLLPTEEYGLIKNKYQFYVPLYREGFDSVPGVGKGVQPGGKMIKTRGGSTRAVVDIIGHSISNLETAIGRAEKARSVKALVSLVVHNPNPDFWSLKEVNKDPRYDSDGNLQMYPNPSDVRPNQLRVMVDGKQMLLEVNRDDATAMRMLKGLRNEDQASGLLVNTLSKVNRYLSTINTSLSPEFIVSNFIRDLQTAKINISDTAVTGKIVRNVPKAIKAIFATEQGKLTGDEWEQWYDRFRKAGGKIGWSDVHGSVANLSKKLEGELAMLQGKRPKMKTLKQVLNLIESTNTSVENGVRLAAFRAAVEQGMSEDRAGQLASDLTVDFTRKGAAGPAINALYLFANASIQGNYRMIRSLVKSKKTRKLVGKVAATAFIVALSNSMQGGDDDDWWVDYEDYVRERNMIIKIPGLDTALKIPMPWGYNVFWNLGTEAARMVTEKRYDLTKGVARTGLTIANSFNPLAAGTLLQTIAPTIADPFAMVAENKSWHGGPLMPEKSPYVKGDQPDSQRYWNSARGFSKSIAAGLNSATGGNPVRSGGIDVSPETIDMIIDQMGGSLLRFTSDIVSTPAKLLSGDDVQLKEVPFLRRVLSSKSEYAASQQYYNIVNEVATFKREMKQFRGTPEYEKLMKKRGRLKRFIIPLKNGERKLTRLRKIRDRRKDNGLDVKGVETKIRNEYESFNKFYNKVMGK